MTADKQTGQAGGLTGDGGRVAADNHGQEQSTTARGRAQVPAAAAGAAIRALLGGGATNNTDPATLGDWREVYASLAAIPDQEGRLRAFDALIRDDRALSRLVAGDPEPQKTRWTVAELYAAAFPEPRWAIPGMIPVGLSILAGRPKVGKSWLGLAIAHAKGTGGRLFDRKVDRGKVLYLALEDSPRRLKDRTEKQGIPSTADITFATTWEPLDAGGLAILQKEIESEHYALVVIDTIGRALGRADQRDIAEMTAIIGNLQQMALLYDVTILAIDHHRKPSGFTADPVDDIIESTAKSANPDAVLGLYREQGKHGATLRGRGRDIEDFELALTWDVLTCCWQSLGDAGEVRRDSVKGEVLAAIAAVLDMGDLATTTTLARHIDKDTGLVSRTLAELVRAGQVVKLAKDGRVQPYGLPPHK
jgi:hypothetical protein